MFACLSLPATAQVYRWVDKDGVVHYTDKPPQPDATPVDLPPLHRMAPAEEVKTEVLVDEAPVAAPTPINVELEIISPEPDQTYRSAERLVPVELALNSPLPDGYRLRYLLDGLTKADEPADALSVVLLNVARGAHIDTDALVQALQQGNIGGAAL
ncbi:MAG: DUF4124 domain-containing protein, partial [Panacagrimonas sp.]